MTPNGHLTRVCPLVSLERLFPGKHTIADVTANTAGWRFALAYELSDRLSPRASSPDSVLTATTRTEFRLTTQAIAASFWPKKKVPLQIYCACSHAAERNAERLTSGYLARDSTSRVASKPGSKSDLKSTVSHPGARAFFFLNDFGAAMFRLLYEPRV